MKLKIAISILSLMLATFAWEIVGNRQYHQVPSLTKKVKRIIPQAAATSEILPNGQIIQIEGEVKLQRYPGYIITPTIGTRIYPEDRLLTASEATVLVQCADLTTWSLKNGQKRKNNCKPKDEKKECSDGIIECPSRTGKIFWNNDIAYIISPRRTLLLETRPTLRWNRVPRAKSYIVRLQLLRERENEITEWTTEWTTEVNETEVVYSGKDPLKPGGKYRLIVDIVDADTEISSLKEQVISGLQQILSLDGSILIPEYALYFHMLEEETAIVVRNKVQEIIQEEWNETTKSLALANIYQEYFLIAKAIEELEKLTVEVQTAPIYRQLGDLYSQYLGLVPQAQEAYQKALELVNSDNVEEKTAIQRELELISRE